MALVPEAEAAAYSQSTGYRVEPTTMVAVVRIAEQDEYRTTFEVVDALRGTFPATFMDNWYASWNLPYPGVPEGEEETWLASVFGLTEYPDGVILGSIYDFRPATPENVSAISAALAAPHSAYDKDQLRAMRENLHAGLRFHYSPWVVSSLVSGLAMECCTGAGGTFVEHEIAQFLRGESAQSGFVTGGHGYYGGEDCGDPFLHGLNGLVDPYEFMETPFDCLEYPAMDSWDANGPHISSGVAVRLPTTPANRVMVDGWLEASPPLYQLFQPDEEVPEEALVQDSVNAPWSQPMDAAEAFLAATHIMLFQIEEVTLDDELEAHRVIFSTTFSTHEFDHLERHFIKLSFRCGDPRLLQPGSRWIGGFVLLDSWSFSPGEVPDLTRSVLIPGALVPEAEMNGQLESDLSNYLN